MRPQRALVSPRALPNIAAARRILCRRRAAYWNLNVRYRRLKPRWIRNQADEFPTMPLQLIDLSGQARQVPFIGCKLQPMGQCRHADRANRQGGPMQRVSGKGYRP